jgi:hypothetical protein
VTEARTDPMHEAEIAAGVAVFAELREPGVGVAAIDAHKDVVAKKLGHRRVVAAGHVDDVGSGTGALAQPSAGVELDDVAEVVALPFDALDDGFDPDGAAMDAEGLTGRETWPRARGHAALHDLPPAARRVDHENV